MKVKAIAKKMSKVRNVRLNIYKTNGAAQGMHSFSMDAVEELIERDAPIMNLTVGTIAVEDGVLTISAY